MKVCSQTACRVLHCGSLNYKKGAIVSQHMVIFQNPDGHPGYNQFESVEEAVAFVEKLRNEQSIESIRIFELNELKFDLKPYYKVQMQALNPGAPSRPAPAAPAPPTSPEQAQPEPAPQGAPSQSPGNASSPFAAPAGGPDSPQPAPIGGPVPPADQPAQDDQPTRRGLFGR